MGIAGRFVSGDVETSLPIQFKHYINRSMGRKIGREVQNNVSNLLAYRDILHLFSSLIVFHNDQIGLEQIGRWGFETLWLSFRQGIIDANEIVDVLSSSCSIKYNDAKTMAGNVG